MDTQKKDNSKRPLFKIVQHVIAWMLGIFYGSGLLYIFFFARRRWGPPPKERINLDLFREKFLYWHTGAVHARPEAVEFYKDLFGNVLLFIPLPFFILYFFGMRSFSRLLLVSFITSLVVETIQFIFRIGVADIDDLFLNTIGALTGLLILHTLFPVSSRQYRLADNWQTADEL
jgi:glycopeptide antibiotics resistance protein